MVTSEILVAKWFNVTLNVLIASTLLIIVHNVKTIVSMMNSMKFVYLDHLWAVLQELSSKLLVLKKDVIFVLMAVIVVPIQPIVTRVQVDISSSLMEL